MPRRNIPKGFTPGDYIREELVERGWTQIDLADIMGRPPQVINEIVSGKRSVTAETARGLADAFGTSAELWLKMEASYQLSKLSAKKDDTVSRRATLYRLGPVKQMEGRGWIEKTSNLDVLEAQILNFYEITAVDQPIPFCRNARKSTNGSLNAAEVAWLSRGRHLARTLEVGSKFSSVSLKLALIELSKLKCYPKQAYLIPQVLSAAGIRFLIIEPLPRTKIDGASFWLDGDSPVIILSMRHDRIDWFWYALMHLVAHVQNGDARDAPRLDVELVGVDAHINIDDVAEKSADLFAVNFLVDQANLDSFVACFHPSYAKLKIGAFASSNGVHPGIVISQLQRRGNIAYAHCRDQLVKVRSIIISCTLTDGWGSTVSA